MRILVTGGAGFLGSHLSEKLLGMGHEVICLDNFYTGYKENIFHLLDNKNFELIRHDVTVPIYLEADGIFNLACPASPVQYQKNPVQTLKTSVHGAINMLGLAKRTGARFLQASTSEVYGKGEAPFDEETTDLVYGPIKYSRWIYACSKQLLDRVIFAMNQRDGFRFTLFRPFNWVGPYLDTLEATSEGSSRLITQLIGDALFRGEVTLVDGGHQKRCFTDVRDGVGALKEILLNEEISNGKIYNVKIYDKELSAQEILQNYNATKTRFGL
jgi:UDP-glucuronate decarboxylase